MQKDFFKLIVLLIQWVATNMSCAETSFGELLKATRCSNLSCLLLLPADALLRASEKIMMKMEAIGCGYAPVTDGVELTTHPWILMSNGKAADVPVLFGTNTDEGAIFTAFPHEGTAEDLNDYWIDKGYSEDEIQTLNDLYVTDKTYPDLSFASLYWWAAQRSYGDDFMSCPSEYTSQMLGSFLQDGSRKSEVYFYHFEHTPRNSCVTRHVAELEYVFHQSELISHKDDEKMADVMSSYWGNFFCTGDPNSISVGQPALPYWEAKDVESDNVLIIKTATDAKMSTKLKEAECSFAIPRIDASIRKSFPPS